jgi:hypothetical protein
MGLAERYAERRQKAETKPERRTMFGGTEPVDVQGGIGDAYARAQLRNQQPTSAATRSVAMGVAPQSADPRRSISQGMMNVQQVGTQGLGPRTPVEYRTPSRIYSPYTQGSAQPASLAMGWQSQANNIGTRYGKGLEQQNIDAIQAKNDAAAAKAASAKVKQQKEYERQVAAYNANRKKTGGFQDLF